MLRILFLSLVAGCTPRGVDVTGEPEPVAPWLDSLARYRDCTGVQELH